MSAPSYRQLLFYGLLGLPVAVVSLPIYIHLPQFYAETIGLDLAMIGFVLLAVRLIDTVQDPLIGVLSDKLQERGFSRQKLILLGLPFLVAGLLMLVNPPGASLLWFAVSLIVLYTAFSFVSINYYAYGAEWHRDYNAQSTISTWREGFVLLGILLASLLPQVLVNQLGDAEGYSVFGWIMTLLILAVSPLALRMLPKTECAQCQHQSISWATRFQSIWRNKPFRWLLIVFFINGIANSIPATLILFYVADVLKVESQTGYFLATYFLAGLAGMPLWLRAAKAYGKKRCLMLSMILASLSFVWAFCLGEGDAGAFYAICVLCGACLGADLAMPPAMLADVIEGQEHNESASYFGIWNLVWKLTFAIAAGIALPLLAAMGYEPNQENCVGQSAIMLAMMYALLPSALKLAATVLLYLSPLEKGVAKAPLKITHKK